MQVRRLSGQLQTAWVSCMSSANALSIGIDMIKVTKDEFVVLCSEGTLVLPLYPSLKGIFIISLCMLYSRSCFGFCLLPYSSLGFVFIFSEVTLSPCVNWLTQKRAGWIIHYVWFNQRIYVSFCFIKCLQIYQSFLSAICSYKVILPNNCNKYLFVPKVKHSLCKNSTWVSYSVTMPVNKGESCYALVWLGFLSSIPIIFVYTSLEKTKEDRSALEVGEEPDCLLSNSVPEYLGRWPCTNYTSVYSLEINGLEMRCHTHIFSIYLPKFWCSSIWESDY